MPQIALYRKYRPSNWDEVLGQDHVVSALRGALNQGDMAHAYLFAGSRGTGKTSVARILAASLGVQVSDLYEIDAASNRGIDDIRELRTAVHTLPLSSPYKCYIVDEVHMLTREAFNALLKTLEEPPSHCLFILATTEMSKLPDTVVSRCQVHNFRKPSDAVLKDALVDIARKEGAKLDLATAEIITLMAEGSFRDAVGLLQKVLGAVGKSIKAVEVEHILGAPPGKLVTNTVEALAEGDCAKALNAIQVASSGSMDMLLFARMLVRSLRFVLLLRYDSSFKERIRESVSEDEFNLLTDLSGKRGARINSSVLSEFLLALEQIPRASVPELPLELAVVKLLGES